MEKNTNSSSIRIYVNKIENRTTFKSKTGYCLVLLTTETMKLLGNTEKKNNQRDIPYLEITKVVLVHCNIANNNYQQYSKVLYPFVPFKPFGSLLEILPTSYQFHTLKYI